MSTIIYCGEFSRQVGDSIAIGRAEHFPTMLNVEQFRAHNAPLQGVVFALFSSLRLDLMREVENALAPTALLYTCFAFERHVMLAPPSSAEGVCAHCFSKRILSNPPLPYSAESMFFLFKLARDFPTMEFQGFHSGIVAMAAQLCLLQAADCSAADHSTLFEIGSARIQSSRILPFHGCTCRSVHRHTCAGPQRFTAFHSELTSWIK